MINQMLELLFVYIHRKDIVGWPNDLQSYLPRRYPSFIKSNSQINTEVQKKCRILFPFFYLKRIYIKRVTLEY